MLHPLVRDGLRRALYSPEFRTPLLVDASIFSAVLLFLIASFAWPLL